MWEGLCAFCPMHSIDRVMERKGLGKEGREQLEGFYSPLNPVAGSGSSLGFSSCVIMGTS